MRRCRKLLFLRGKRAEEEDPSVPVWANEVEVVSALHDGEVEGLGA